MEPVFRPAGGHGHNKLIKKVLVVFRAVDRAVKTFQQKTPLSCESGCGRCCLSPRVETTVLEMYPLADFLLKTGEAEKWYTVAQDKLFQGPCIFYSPDALQPGKGRCQVYPFRPAICRLYGFSAFIDKYGAKRLATCVVIKNNMGRVMADIQKRIAQGLKIPVMKDFSARFVQLHPMLGGQYRPINAAFKEAVERLAVLSQKR
jgi:Fe-S-cluster containining protein